MGKKYIIELLDECNSKFKGIMVFGLTQEKQISVEMIPEESMTPYTEPDTEQVRKEGYKKGLSDAWDAARKIWEYDTTTLRVIFGEGIMRMDWFMKFTASEAIEKIRQYEQEKEVQIHFGDEIRNKQTPDIRVCVTNVRGGRWDGFALSDVENYCRFGSGYNDRYLDGWEKTGRNFATILQQMGDENVEQK